MHKSATACNSTKFSLFVQVFVCSCLSVCLLSLSVIVFVFVFNFNIIVFLSCCGWESTNKKLVQCFDPLSGDTILLHFSPPSDAIAATLIIGQIFNFHH